MVFNQSSNGLYYYDINKNGTMVATLENRMENIQKIYRTS